MTSIRSTINNLLQGQQGSDIVIANCSGQLTEEVIALAARSGVSLDDLNEILESAHFYGTMFDMLDWVDDEKSINLSSEKFLCDLQDLVINVIDPQLVAAGLK